MPHRGHIHHHHHHHSSKASSHYHQTQCLLVITTTVRFACHQYLRSKLSCSRLEFRQEARRTETNLYDTIEAHTHTNKVSNKKHTYIRIYTHKHVSWTARHHYHYADTRNSIHRASIHSTPCFSVYVSMSLSLSLSLSVCLSLLSLLLISFRSTHPLHPFCTSTFAADDDVSSYAPYI